MTQPQNFILGINYFSFIYKEMFYRPLSFHTSLWTNDETTEINQDIPLK